MAEPDLTQLNALLADERERGRQEILDSRKWPSTGIAECKECGRFRGAEHPRCEVCGSNWSRAVEPPEVTGSTSDGYHTFDELYEFRLLYHAAFVNTRHLAEERLGVWPTTVKSLNHSDGEKCFGGGWFIVVTHLPGVRQISNHYEVKHWDLFHVPAVDTPPAFDDHTAADVLYRLREFLKDD